MSKNVSYILQKKNLWYGIRLQVNVVPQCRNTLQYVVSYVKFLEDFVQTMYCSSNEKKKYKCLHRVRDAGSYIQVRRQTDENWHDSGQSGPQKFPHKIFDKRGAILWWLFEEPLKVFTWLVVYKYCCRQVQMIQNMTYTRLILRHLWNIYRQGILLCRGKKHGSNSNSSNKRNQHLNLTKFIVFWAILISF